MYLSSGHGENLNPYQMHEVILTLSSQMAESYLELCELMASNTEIMCWMCWSVTLVSSPACQATNTTSFFHYIISFVLSNIRILYLVIVKSVCSLSLFYVTDRVPDATHTTPDTNSKRSPSCFSSFCCSYVIFSLISSRILVISASLQIHVTFLLCMLIYLQTTLG